MKNFIKYLCYVLILLFPTGVLLRIKLAPNIWIMPQDLIVILLTTVLILYAKKNKISFEFGRFFKFQSLFIGVGLVSLFANTIIFNDTNILTSLLYVIRYIAYLSILATGIFFQKDNIIKKALLASCAVFLFAGILQFFLFYDLQPLFALGWDQHLYRLFSTFLDPNFAGVCYVLIFLFFLQVAIKRSFQSGYLFIILSFFTFIAILITYSRTALAGLIVGLITLCMLYKKIKFIMVIGIVMILLLFAVSDTSIEGLNPFRTHSTSQRLSSVREAIHVIQSSNYMGVGLNAYRYAQVRYGIRNEIGILTSNSDGSTDNSLLFVLATTGLLGLFFYLASFLYLFRWLFQEGRGNYFYISMLTAFLASSLFLNVLFYTPLLTLLFLLIATRKHFQ